MYARDTIPVQVEVVAQEAVIILTSKTLAVTLGIRE